jgi:hypothetical protein
VISLDNPTRINREVIATGATAFAANPETSNSGNIPKTLVTCERDLGES